MPRDPLDDNFETSESSESESAKPSSVAVMDKPEAAIESDDALGPSQSDMLTIYDANNPSLPGEKPWGDDGGRVVQSEDLNKDAMQAVWKRETSENKMLGAWEKIIKANTSHVKHQTEEAQVLAGETVGLGLPPDANPLDTSDVEQSQVADNKVASQPAAAMDGKSNEALSALEPDLPIEDTQVSAVDSAASSTEDTSEVFTMPKPPIRQVGMQKQAIKAMAEGFGADTKANSAVFGQMDLPKVSTENPFASDNRATTAVEPQTSTVQSSTSETGMTAQPAVAEKGRTMTDTSADPEESVVQTSPSPQLKVGKIVGTTIAADQVTPATQTQTETDIASQLATDTQSRIGTVALNATETATEAAGQPQTMTNAATETVTQTAPETATSTQTDIKANTAVASEQTVEQKTPEMVPPEQVRELLAEVGLTGLDEQTRVFLERNTPILSKEELYTLKELDSTPEEGERIKAKVNSETISDMLPEAQWQQHAQELGRLMAILAAGRGPIPARTAGNSSFGYSGDFSTRDEILEAVKDQAVVTAASAVLMVHQNNLDNYKQALSSFVAGVGVEQVLVDIKPSNDSQQAEQWQSNPPSTIYMTLQKNILTVVILPPTPGQTSGLIGLDKQAVEIKQ